MNKELAFCKVVSDRNDIITKWICNGLNIKTDWLGKHFTIGFFYKSKLIGGLIYHDIRPYQDVWWTLYTNDKHWCTRRILHFMFSVAFDYFDCRRISIRTTGKNKKCIKLANQLGFKTEGILRRYANDGDDVIIMGILKEQSHF